MISIRRVWPYIAIVAAALAAMGGLLSDGTPLGYRHDWNIPFFSAALRSMWHGTDGFTVWNAQQFGTAPFYPTLAPFQGLISGLAFIGLSAGIIERLIIFAALILAGSGMMALVRSQGIRPFAAVLAGIAYLSSPFVFTELGKGILQDPLSYACLPWVAWLFIRGTVCATPRRSYLYAAGVLWAISSFQVQYIAFNGIILLVLAIANRSFGAFILTALVALLSDAYFLVPAAPVFHEISTSVGEVSAKSFVNLWSPSVFEVIRSTGCNCTFPEQAVYARGVNSLWVFGGFAFFLAAVSGLILHRNRVGRSLIVLLAISIVLAGGTSVLGPAYLWLLSHVPAGYAFRESFKFTALVSFCTAFGIGAFVTWISEHMKGTRTLGLAAACFAALLVVVNGIPFFADGLETQIQRVHIPPEAQKAYDYLARQPGDSRAAYLPMLVPMQPEGSTFPGIDPIISWPARLSFGNYLSTPFSKALASAIYHGDPAQCLALLRWGGVQYVDDRLWLTEHFAQNTDAHNVDGDTATFDAPGLPLTMQALHLRPVQNFSKAGQERLYEIQPRETAVNRSNTAPIIATGDLTDAAVLGELSSSVVYAAQTSDSTSAVDAYRSINRIVLTDNEQQQIPMSLVPRKFMFRPGRYATSTNANAGWGNFDDWNTWWWYRNEYADSLADVALAGPSTHDSLIVPLPAGVEKRRLLIRVYQGPNNGSLGLALDGKPLTVLRTFDPQANRFRWINVGTIAPMSRGVNLQITNLSGENAIAEIAAVPVTAYKQAQSEAAGILRRGTVAYALTPRSGADVKVAAAGLYRVNIMRESPKSATDQMCITINGKQIDVHNGENLPVAANSAVRVGQWGDAALAVTLTPPAFDRAKAKTAQLSKIGPERYRAELDGPSLVLLNTNYSNNWIASRARVHLTVNGFANGWIVDSDGPITVSYRLQTLATVGRIISCLTVLLGILLLLTIPIREARYATREHLYPIV